MNAVAQLKEKGRVTRGRIGVQITEVSKETAESFGLAKPTGALVNSVEKGGPADKAGVEAGDIVLKADGREVRNSSELPRIITMIKPGSKVTLTVWHKGASKDLTVTVAEIRTRLRRPSARKADRRPRKGQTQPAGPRAVGPHRQAEERAGRQERVLVERHLRVRARQRAARDVILAIVSRGQTTEAKSAEQINGLLTKMDKGASVTFRLRRDGRSSSRPSRSTMAMARRAT
jgi:serine protease Do